MSTSAPQELRRELAARRASVARAWQEAVEHTSFSPLDAREIHRRLLRLTDRLFDALLADPPDAERGRAVGAELVRLHYAQPEALGGTLTALARALTADLRPDLLSALQPRLGGLLGDLAAGFSREVRQAVLAEQEEIRGAWLVERQQAQEALRASEDRFRAVFERAAIGIGLTDVEGRIMATNPAWATMLGYRPEELRGKPFAEFVHPDDLRASWALYAELMAGRIDHVELDQRQFRRDGVVLWYHVVVSLVRDAAGQPRFAIGMAENITERKRAEEALARQVREAEEARGETRAILDATVEGVLLIAPDGVIRTANQRFAELFPVDAARLLGRPFPDVREEFAAIFAEPAAADLVSDAIADPERRFVRYLNQRWPERRELELFSTPVRGSGGDWVGRLYAFRDVTREREVDRMKSEFVSLVSHELRTPLTSIKGYIELMLAGDVGELAEEQREFLTIVKNNSDRLASLIAELLDLSRIESGRIELRRALLDLRQIIGDVVALFRPQFERKGQRLTVAVADALPPVWGDADRIVQILTNLVSNANKYTPPGGAITIAAQAEGAQVCIAVRDSGIGMSAEEQAQLFTRFFRARNRVAQEAGGTGLGLAITRSLIELHGGAIRVESAPGQGSTFTVTLPSAPATARHLALTPTSQPGGRVLVVDDEREIAQLLRRYLERAGYTVSVAHEAGEALRLARLEHPNLITLDVRMPDADGFTTLEWLKRDPATAAIPVMFISILEDNGRGKLLGAVDYLTKPVEEQSLLDHVAAVLAGASQPLVLLADDEADVRQLLAHLLRSRGYRVVEAADGAEAVALAQHHGPDLALLDVRMPGTDGLAALAALRADPATRSLPVIMLTASPGALEVRQSAVEQLGLARLVIKPSTAEELAAAIAEVL